MKNCVYNKSRCVLCGRPIPPGGRGHARACARGLGDVVADGLAAVGITPERVAAAIGVEDCGCERRKELLTRLGRAIGIGRQSGQSPETA
jgi:hypothetical protein